MNNDPIMPTELTMKDKKKVIKGKVSRAALYARSKVVEVETEEKETYYLLYYRNHLIFGDRLDEDQVKEETFIGKAFREGCVIQSPHPLLTPFIPQITVSLPHRNKIFSQLQTQFSPQEIAYIATMLDSFFTNDRLEQVIDKLYFHYRRSGNFKKSFQVLQILTDFLPDSKTAQERLHSHDYYAYQDYYATTSLTAIYQKDPLYAELYCFKNRSKPENRSHLVDMLKTQNNVVEQLLLWLENDVKDEIDAYSKLALQLVTYPEWLFILAKGGVNPFQILPEAKRSIEKMLADGSYQTAALHLLPFMNELPKSYDSIKQELWENLPPEFVVSYLDEFLQVLAEANENEQDAEVKIFQLGVSLLEGFELKSRL